MVKIRRRPISLVLNVLAVISIFLAWTVILAGATPAAGADKLPEFGVNDDIACGDYVYKIASCDLKKQDGSSDNYFISVSVKNTGPEGGAFPPIALVNVKSKKEVKPKEKLPNLEAGSTVLLNLNFSVEKNAAYNLRVSGDPGGYLTATVDLGGGTSVSDPKNELITAAEEGDANKIRELLKKGADPNTVNSKKETVLMLAAGSGNRDAVKALLDKGANYKTLNLDDEHALFYAIRSGDYDTVKLLLDKGANTYYTNARGKTPLIEAKNHCDEKVIELVRKYSDRGF